MRSFSTVGIIGFGRFGALLASILKEDFTVAIFEPDKNRHTADYNFVDLKTLYTSDAIFYCVPIDTFQQVIQAHRKYFTPNTVLIDVLSVKVHPEKVFTKYLPDDIEALLTHPMFGPDSVKAKGLEQQPLIMSQFRASNETYTFWKSYFAHKKLRIIEMSPKEHDRLAAKSQGLTHFIGRVLEKFGLERTPIDSFGATKLNDIKEQTTNDTWQLFTNLQNYNPYTKAMRLKIGKAYDSVYNTLLPDRMSQKTITFGIQGGKGSFNDSALADYVKRHGITKYKIKYLYTTEKVLNNLHKGNIDFGLFAIHNSRGGMVKESIKAIARYKFEIVEEFAIKIAHVLMKLKTVSTDSIKIVIAHDQVLAQCKNTLAEKYPYLEQKVGEGDYIDTATAARAIVQGKLPQNMYILGNERISEIYTLEIVARDLQDSQENWTSFLLVKTGNPILH